MIHIQSAWSGYNDELTFWRGHGYAKRNSRNDRRVQEIWNDRFLFVAEMLSACLTRKKLYLPRYELHAILSSTTYVD